MAATPTPARSRFYETDAASFLHRAVGYFIDLVIDLVVGGVLSFVLYLAILPDNHTQDQVDNARAGVTIFVVVVLYAYKWIADSLGGTVGKLIVGLRVVDDHTKEPIGLVNGFIRTFFAFFSGLAWGLGYLWAAWDRERKTWHDHAVKSSVIKRPR
jgi:uncharacterized RDD family membrane protein YckC